MAYDIYKEINRLRQKHGRDRSAINRIPSYKVEQNVSPLSNVIATRETTYRKPNIPPEHLIVSHLHKQGYQVISRDDVQYAGGKKP
jgi:hypothetical protein